MKIGLLPLANSLQTQSPSAWRQTPQRWSVSERTTFAPVAGSGRVDVSSG